MTIGPDPMMRTRLMSERLGIRLVLAARFPRPLLVDATRHVFQSVPENRRTGSQRRGDRATLPDDTARRTRDAADGAGLRRSGHTDSDESPRHRPGARPDPRRTHGSAT